MRTTIATATPAPARSISAWAASVPPHPITNRAQNEAALLELRRLDRLAERKKATKVEQQTANVLALLIKDYETRRFGRPPRGTPLERLQYVIEQSGLSESDLGRLLGDRALGHRVLTGERELSKAHIRKLADHFKLDPGYFM